MVIQNAELDIIGVITEKELVAVWAETLRTNDDGFAGLPIKFVELLGIVIVKGQVLA